MAISTYAELSTAAANWLSRSDLTSRIPEFITLAEARINRKLRIRQQETASDVTITGGTRTAALPSDFREVRRLYLDTSPIRILDYISPQDYWARYVSTNTGKPSVFTIEGANIVLGPIPDTGYTGKLTYYAAFPALSTTAHGTFTANPDLYLYGTLLSAEPYLKNDKRIGMWKSLFDEILMEMERQQSRNAGPMRMRDDYNPQ